MLRDVNQAHQQDSFILAQALSSQGVAETGSNGAVLLVSRPARRAGIDAEKSVSLMRWTK